MAIEGFAHAAGLQLLHVAKEAKPRPQTGQVEPAAVFTDGNLGLGLFLLSDVDHTDADMTKLNSVVVGIYHGRITL